MGVSSAVSKQEEIKPAIVAIVIRIRTWFFAKRWLVEKAGHVVIIITAIVVAMEFCVSLPVGVSCAIVMMPDAVLVSGAIFLMANRCRRQIAISLIIVTTIVVAVEFLMSYAMFISCAAVFMSSTVLVARAVFLMANGRFARSISPSYTVVGLTITAIKFTHFIPPHPVSKYASGNPDLPTI